MRVTSARNERVQAVRRLARDPAERRRLGACVIEGIRPAADYLRGQGPVRLALVSPRLLELGGGPELSLALGRALSDRPDDLLETTDEILASAADARAPQGVLVVAPLPALDGLPRADGRPVLVAWEMQDPGNVGALVRIAEGSGCAALVIARAPGGAAADPFSPRALRGAAGSSFRLPLHAFEGEPGDLARALLDGGFSLVACVPRGGAPPEEADLSGSPAILVGSEGHGLPARLVAPPCSGVTIPLEGAAESLNAAAAAAIVAFEAARRRRG